MRSGNNYGIRKLTNKTEVKEKYIYQKKKKS